MNRVRLSATRIERRHDVEPKAGTTAICSLLCVSLWERIRAALRREKGDLDDAVGDFEKRANSALDQRERELHATPEEKLAMEQERGAELDADFEAVRKRIEGGSSS